jgi:hypothetical protein
MNTTDPLDDVIKEFEKWRTMRGKRGPIPDSLRALVKPLEGQYSPNRIVKALHINHEQLKSFFGLSHQESKQKPKQKSMTLIECSVPTVSSISKSQGATLIFNCRNGQAVTINGLHGSDIEIAISSLIKE